MTKKLFAAVLAAALILSLAACGAAPAREDGQTDETRIVTDVWGRSVTIPQTVGSIVCLGSGAPRLAAYLDVMELAVGAEEHDIAAMTALRDYLPVHHETLAALPAVGAGGGSGANNAYPEELIALAPDVILAGFSAEAANELQAQTNIPVVAVRYVSNGLADESFYAAMRVFADVTGAQERCEAVLAFIDDCKADLAARTAAVSDTEKLRAYAGAVTFSGRHGFTGTYSNFGPFAAIGARNVADAPGIAGYYETDFEQIIAWDPDVIFLDPGNLDLVRDEYATNPAVFDAVRAVREGRVYSMPSFNNCGMNITYALTNAYHAGTVLFPAEFADVDIAQTSAEILVFFLGEDSSGAMADSGLTYGAISIGE